MRPRDLAARIDETFARLDLLELEKRTAEALPGVSAQAYDRDAVAGGAVSDPTGNAGTRERPDVHRAEREKMLNLLIRVDADLGALLHLQNRYATPEIGSRDRARAANEPGCWFCHTIGQYAQPGPTATPTTIGGRLDVARLVCSAHYYRIHKTGVVPTRDDNQRWHDTGRWPRLTEGAQP